MGIFIAGAAAECCLFFFKVGSTPIDRISWLLKIRVSLSSDSLPRSCRLRLSTCTGILLFCTRGKPKLDALIASGAPRTAVREKPVKALQRCRVLAVRVIVIVGVGARRGLLA